MAGCDEVPGLFPAVLSVSSEAQQQLQQARETLEEARRDLLIEGVRLVFGCRGLLIGNPRDRHLNALKCLKSVVEWSVEAASFLSAAADHFSAQDNANNAVEDVRDAINQFCLCLALGFEASELGGTLEALEEDLEDLEDELELAEEAEDSADLEERIEEVQDTIQEVDELLDELLEESEEID